MHIRVIFKGLCGFQDASDSVHVFLPVGHHYPPHRPLLSIPMDNINLELTNWLPDAVIETADGETGTDVLGIWDLAERSVVVGGGDDPPPWNGTDRDLLVCLRKYNAGCPVSIGKGRTGRVSLHGGELYRHQIDTRLLMPYVMQNGSTVQKDSARNYASCVRWEGHAEHFFARGLRREITLRANSNGDGLVAHVANLSPDSDGLEHFHNYYDLLPTVAAADQIQLQQIMSAAPSGGREKPLSPTEGVDCVPPSDLPPG
jgi:hypothetical protein